MSFLAKTNSAFKARYDKYLPSLKEHWKKHLRSTVIIFVIVFTIFIIIDQVSKSVVFNGDRSGAVGGIQADWGFMAFRSQFHSSTTFLDFIGSTLPRAASLAINYILLFIFCLLLSMSTSRFTSFAISLALTGIIGNTIDATYLYGVRNVIFLGWASGGVFNFADAYIVVGTPLIAIAYIVEYVLTRKKRNEEEQITTKDLDIKMTNEAPLEPKVQSVKALDAGAMATHPDAFPELVTEVEKPKAVSLARVKKPVSKIAKTSVVKTTKKVATKATKKPVVKPTTKPKQK